MSRSPSAEGSGSPEVQEVNSIGTACCQRWSGDELREEQRDDPHLSVGSNCLKAGGDRPSRADAQGTSQVTRNLLAQWNRLQLVNRVLYRLWKSEAGSSTRSQLVIPRHLLPDVLKALHDAPTASHLGTTPIAVKIRSDSIALVYRRMYKIGADSVLSVYP